MSKDCSIFPDGQQRPATFDARVMGYYGALQAKARRLTKTEEERDELVQDTIAYVLGAWRNFRGDTSEPRNGMYNWLTLNMRAIAQGKRRRKHPIHVELADWDKATPARQEDIVDAANVLRRLSYTREGRMLARYAKGETYAEIGARRKVSGNRIQQLVEKARERLVRSGVAV